MLFLGAGREEGLAETPARAAMTGVIVVIEKAISYRLIVSEV